MPKVFIRHKCFFCGKNISANGLAKTSHYRKHVREGIAYEVGYNRGADPDSIDFYPVKKST